MTKRYAGIDISHYQSPSLIDYKRLAKAKIGGRTVKFAFIKISQGDSVDPCFQQHYNGCKGAGIYVGVYHWLTATTPEAAKAEAESLVNRLKPYSIDYPVVLDFEDKNLLSLKLSKTRYTQIVDAFMQPLMDANYYVMLYCNPACLQSCLLPDITDRYDLWLAHYTDKPAQYGQTIWQYTALGTPSDVAKGYALSVGSVDGVSCPIDVNWCYVGYAKRIKKLGKNKPVDRYTVTGTKTVNAAGLTAAVNQLKAMGYEVTEKQI